jgi:hypothetical protein
MTAYMVGTNQPFDPARVSEQLASCILCFAPVAIVGIFIPQTPDMQAAVLRLRQHPLSEGRSTGIAYGLCRRHAADFDRSTEGVEAAIVAAADRVVMQ